MDTVKGLKDDVAGVTKHYKHNILSQAVKEVGNCSFHDFEDLDTDKLLDIVRERYFVPDDGKVYKPNDKNKFVYSADKRIWRMYLINKDGTEEVGGWVENPQYLLGDENWVGENAVLKDFITSELSNIRLFCTKLSDTKESQTVLFINTLSMTWLLPITSQSFKTQIPFSTAFSPTQFSSPNKY